MRIAIIGQGSMGKAVEMAAKERNLLVVASIGRSLEWDKAVEADVWIDFSSPEITSELVKHALVAKKPLVIGTTGWEKDLSAITQRVQKEKGALFFSPNFSLGVHLFNQIVKKAASLIDRWDLYDVAMLEMHRRTKSDHPSGTALELAKGVIGKCQKESLSTQLPEGVLDKQMLQLSSLRCGDIPGTHTVLFDSSVDTIELTHRAKNRFGFAQGALLAAQWLQGRQGVFTFEDLFK